MKSVLQLKPQVSNFRRQKTLSKQQNKAFSKKRYKSLPHVSFTLLKTNFIIFTQKNIKILQLKFYIKSIRFTLRSKHGLTCFCIDVLQSRSKPDTYPKILLQFINTHVEVNNFIQQNNNNNFNITSILSNLYIIKKFMIILEKSSLIDNICYCNFSNY